MRCSFLILMTMVLQDVFAQKFVYPTTRKDDVSDMYFGKSIPDPYRWLEDDNSPETKKWVEEQNKFTNQYLSKIPGRERIHKRLSEVWNYAKYSTPFKKGKYFFHYKNDGMQNQSVLYIQDDLDDDARVLIDPNKLSNDGTTSLAGFYPSSDSKYAAYSISKAGSDWNEFFVINMETGELLKDHITHVKWSGVSWRGNGFFYSRYDKPEDGKELTSANSFHKVYFHMLGQDQSEDRIVYQEPSFPQLIFSSDITDDQRFLIISISESTSGNRIIFKDLTNPADKFREMNSNYDFDFNVIDHVNGLLLVYTNYNAPKYRLIAVNPENPNVDEAKEIIPESEDVLTGVSLCADRLVAQYLSNVSSKLNVLDLNGKFEKTVKLPGIGMVGGFSSDRKEKFAFYSFTSFTQPSTIYSYDIFSNTSKIYNTPKLSFNSDDYETKQVFYKSKDGTKIPMFITMKKGVTLNGNHPVYLYGYGGFNISITPGFSPQMAVFLEAGGIYAVANIRGGGEYGTEWHRNGTKLKKQNVFDDFIAAAEYLIENKYTNASKIAISGRSNGGLLIGACMTQRPDLFKVALPAVGVLDMLRYHKFTIGYAWAGDYGRSDEKDQFPNLLSYSPLHNVKAVEYPATMVLTADHDDRVVPAHSFKFAAELQSKAQGKNPVLIRIDVNAGHGAGKPTSKTIDEWADVWTFTFHHLGMGLK